MEASKTNKQSVLREHWNEGVIDNEILDLSFAVAELKITPEQRDHLCNVIKNFALRERQKGYVDGIKAAIALLEKQVVK